MKPLTLGLILPLLLFILPAPAAAAEINSFWLKTAQSRYTVISTADSGARSNDSTRARDVIIPRNQSVQAVLKQVINRLIRAYKTEDPQRFMELVSDDYTGGKLNLDSAVRRDFTLLDNIEIQATLTGFAVDSEGYAHVSLTYSRYVTSARSGGSLQDKGLTEMVFKMDDKRFRLYSMKKPLIFGLSDAENVASGKVNSGGDDEILVIEDNGKPRLLPFSKAVE